MFAPNVNGYICRRVRTPAPANGITVEVVIDELCTRIVNRIPKMIALKAVLNIYLSKNCSTRLRTKLLSNLTIANSIPNVSKTLNTIKRVLLSKLIASICFAPHLIAFLIGLLNTSSELIVPKSSLPRPVAAFSRIPNAISNGNRIITASKLKKSWTVAAENALRNALSRLT